MGGQGRQPADPGHNPHESTLRRPMSHVGRRVTLSPDLNATLEDVRAHAKSDNLVEPLEWKNLPNFRAGLHYSSGRFTSRLRKSLIKVSLGYAAANPPERAPGGLAMQFNRGFGGRRRATRQGLPPGQYDVGQDWPVLTAEVTPHLDTERWTMTVDGLVATPTTWSCTSFRSRSMPGTSTA